MVNHFLLENEELIERLITIIKESGYWDETYEEVYFSDNDEIFDVKTELLNRMKIKYKGD